MCAWLCLSWVAPGYLSTALSFCTYRMPGEKTSYLHDHSVGPFWISGCLWFRIAVPRCLCPSIQEEDHIEQEHTQVQQGCEPLSLLTGGGSPAVISGPVALKSPRNLSKMHILGPHPSTVESGIWDGAQQLVLQQALHGCPMHAQV